MCRTQTERSGWRKTAVVIACLLVSTLIACGGGSSSSTVPHLAYVAGGQTNVVGLRIKSTGEFQTILGSPFVSGNGPSSVIVHPSNKFLFVANQSEGTISLFTINPNSGALTEVLPRTPAGTSPVAMVMDSGGTLLFVANQGANPSILVFSIGSNGALSGLGQLPVRACAELFRNLCFRGEFRNADTGRRALFRQRRGCDGGGGSGRKVFVRAESVNKYSYGAEDPGESTRKPCHGCRCICSFVVAGSGNHRPVWSVSLRYKLRFDGDLAVQR